VEDWVDRLADELGDPRVSPGEMGAILRFARRVAHGVERKLAPVSAFVLGVAVGRRTAEGLGREAAFDQALSKANTLVPETAEAEEG
jgi:hypothetical protein